MPPKAKPTQNNHTNSDLFSRKEAAEYLGISPQTLAIWSCSGRYQLPMVKVGRLSKYKRGDLDSFLARRTQSFDGDLTPTTVSKRKQPSASQSIEFAELRLVERSESSLESPPSPRSEPGLELVLPSGIKLRVGSVDLLPSVLAILEKR
jgi:hypothetical protein